MEDKSEITGSRRLSRRERRELDRELSKIPVEKREQYLRKNGIVRVGRHNE